MENNIFIKLKKDKHNPDIENKLKQIENERDTTTFTMVNNIYNPITGIIPSQINNNKDLILEKDKIIGKNEIQNLILLKETERNNQDNIYKPTKTKVINNNLSNNNLSNNNLSNNNLSNNKVILNEPPIRSNYIETFEDLKKGAYNKQSKNISNSNNYNNILDGLKDLGIIK
jgi:hypothetical protein